MMASPKDVKKDMKAPKGPVKVVAKGAEKTGEKAAVKDFGNSYETARLLRAEQEAVRVMRPSYEALGALKAQTKRRWWWPFGKGMPVASDVQANMQEVRAGVIQNMETLSQKGGVAVRGEPFKNIMLPQVRKVGMVERVRGGLGRFLSRFWRWGMVAALVVLAVVWWQGREMPPAQVLGRALVAMRNGDVTMVEELVDVKAVAGSVVNQVFAMPRPELAMMPERLAKMVAEERKLDDFEGFVKPGMVEALADEFLASVEQGEVVRGGVLGLLWEALGEEKVKLEPAKVAMADGRLVVMELPLRREDLNMSLPLQVVLDRGESGKGKWQVADVPNFAAVLGQMGELAVRQEERGGQGMLVEILEPAAGPEVTAAVVGKRAVRGGIELTMRVKNEGAAMVRDVPLWVGMGDANGRCLMVFKVVVPGTLAAGEERMQAWRVGVPTVGKARFVRSLPLEAMRIDVRPLK